MRYSTKFTIHLKVCFVSNAPKCVKLHAGLHEDVPYSYGNQTESKLHFTIINVENDQKVLSQIQNQEENILKYTNSRIIGLRDMYSERYRDITHGIIDSELNKKFIDESKNSISRMSDPGRISFHFAIMEVESWWISMFTIFEKIDPLLTLDYIQQEIGINLSEVNVEEYVFHPYIKLKKILESVGKQYNKKYSDVEAITRQITIQDIEVGISNDRCVSLRDFYKELCSFVL